MAEIRHVALVMPAEFNAELGILTAAGHEEARAAAVELRKHHDSRGFFDPVMLAALGQEGHFATANLIGAMLAKESCTVIPSPQIGELNDNPEAGVLDLKGLLGRAIVGDPPYYPAIDHEGNVVAVVSPEVIVALTGLSRVDEVDPASAYFPDLR